MNLKNNFLPALAGSLLFVLIISLVVLLNTIKSHKLYLATHVLVTQEFLDSLTIVANKPPIVTVKDSIVYDTIYIKETHHPKPEPVDSLLNKYSDSLVIKDQVNVSINFKTSGLVQGGINWTYKPIYKLITVTIDRPKPFPVTKYINVPVYKTGVYLSGAVDWNKTTFLIGGDLDIITKNDYIYGLEYRRFGDQNIYGGKFGIRLFKNK